MALNPILLFSYLIIDLVKSVWVQWVPFFFNNVHYVVVSIHTHTHIYIYIHKITILFKTKSNHPKLLGLMNDHSLNVSLGSNDLMSRIFAAEVEAAGRVQNRAAS